MSNQDLNCRNDLLMCLYRSDLDRVKFNSHSILEKNHCYLGKLYWIRTNDTFLKRKVIIQQRSCLFKQKKSDYTLTTLIPSLYLLARIRYHRLRGGGDREAKPPLQYILTTLRLDYMLIFTLFCKNRNYEKHQKTIFLVSRIVFEPMTLSLKREVFAVLL